MLLSTDSSLKQSWLYENNQKVNDNLSVLITFPSCTEITKFELQLLSQWKTNRTESSAQMLL